MSRLWSFQIGKIQYLEKQLKISMSLSLTGVSLPPRKKARRKPCWWKEVIKSYVREKNTRKKPLMSYLPKTAAHPANATRFSFFVYRSFKLRTVNGIKQSVPIFKHLFLSYELKQNMNREINFVFCFIIRTTKNDIKKLILFSYFV